MRFDQSIPLAYCGNIGQNIAIFLFSAFTGSHVAEFRWQESERTLGCRGRHGSDRGRLARWSPCVRSEETVRPCERRVNPK